MPGVISLYKEFRERQKKNTCRKEENKARSIFFSSYALQRKREPLSKDKTQVLLSKRNKSNETACETEGFFLFWIENVLWILLFFYFGIIWFSEVLNINNYSGESKSFTTSENQALFLWWRTMWTPFLSFLCCISSSHLLGKPLPSPMLKNMILFYQFKKILCSFPQKSQVRATQISF